MESRLEFATEKDITKQDGIKVPYVSDPMVDINERIDQKPTQWYGCLDTPMSYGGYYTWKAGIPPPRCFCANGMSQEHSSRCQLLYAPYHTWGCYSPGI